ncbi:MAG: carboxypeptidase-like regulatory domain-containing protein [Janthinobacterium lividum]
MRPTTILLPTPCTESWNAMTPAGAGRHCAACAKTVVDFTQKTDAEILALLAQAAGGTCGRFRAGQLARPLQLPASASRWRSWLAAVVAVWGLRQGAAEKAQAQVPVVQVAPPANVLLAKALPLAPPLAAIRGVVLDSAGRLAMPGTTVMLKGTSLGTSTDVNGHFTLDLPAGQEYAHQGTLLVSMVGYIKQEIPVSLDNPVAAPLEVVLAPDHTALGETVIIGGYVSRKPWPWHPRTLYYRVTRPFRR